MRGLVSIVSFSILGLFLRGLAPAQAQAPEHRPGFATTVAIVLFDGVQIIDYTGPYEVFGQAGFKVFTVAERLDTVVTHMGMQVIPHFDLTETPPADIVVVPGGGVPHALPKDHPIIRWLLDRQHEARYVLSVCNGAFVLAAAGLLDDKEATTYAPMISHLSMVAPTVKPVYDRRFVESGKVITAGGLSAGIDAALHIVSRIKGEGRAREVANNMEYNWDPGSTYVRSRLPDLLLAPVLDFSPPLIGREVLRYDGDETHWVSEYEIPRREAADAFANQFEKLARGAGWKKIETDESQDAIGATWRFTDHRGQSWTCVSSMTQTTDGTLVLRLRLNLETVKRP